MFFGGGTPSLLRRGATRGHPRGHPTAPGRRDDGRVQPREPSTPPSRGPTTLAASLVCSFGVQSMAPHALAALGSSPRPGTVEAAVGLAREAGFDLVQRRPDLRGAGGVARRLGTTLDGADPARRAHVSAYALTVEPERHRQPTRGATRPRRHFRPTSTFAGRPARGGGARLVRGLELGAAGCGVPPQPPVLERG